MQTIKFLRLMIAALLLITAAGCATLSKESCEQGDWYGIGYDDGTDGHSLDRLVGHKKACFEHNVSPDEDAYRRGREDGIKIYCTYQNGYDEGEDMQKYGRVCPAELEQDFFRGYLLGLEAAENELYRKISKKNREIIKSTLSLQTLKGKSLKKETKKIERLERELESAEDDIADIYKLKRRYGL